MTEKEPLYSTPDISHITEEDRARVYEPAEDSFLMLDALEKDVDYLNHIKPSVCVEVGCGSGICLTFLAQILNLQSLYIATDINPAAVQLCQKTSKRNRVAIETIQTDLLNSLLPRLGHQVDVLLFNPPYVVTSSSEVGSHGIEASWAGGVKGREVIDRLLPYIDGILSPSGLFYLVVIKENKLEEIEERMGRERFRCEVVLSRRSGPEHLSILRFTRNKNNSSLT